MLGLKLNHVSKRGHCWHQIINCTNDCRIIIIWPSGTKFSDTWNDVSKECLQSVNHFVQCAKWKHFQLPSDANSNFWSTAFLSNTTKYVSTLASANQNSGVCFTKDPISSKSSDVLKSLLAKFYPFCPEANGLGTYVYQYMVQCLPTTDWYPRAALMSQGWPWCHMIWGCYTGQKKGVRLL